MLFSCVWHLEKETSNSWSPAINLLPTRRGIAAGFSLTLLVMYTICAPASHFPTLCNTTLITLDPNNVSSTGSKNINRTKNRHHRHQPLISPLQGWSFWNTRRSNIRRDHCLYLLINCTSLLTLHSRCLLPRRWPGPYLSQKIGCFIITSMIIKKHVKKLQQYSTWPWKSLFSKTSSQCQNDYLLRAQLYGIANNWTDHVHQLCWA